MYVHTGFGFRGLGSEAAERKRNLGACLPQEHGTMPMQFFGIRMTRHRNQDGCSDLGSSYCRVLRTCPPLAANYTPLQVSDVSEAEVQI